MDDDALPRLQAAVSRSVAASSARVSVVTQTTMSLPGPGPKHQAAMETAPLKQRLVNGAVMLGAKGIGELLKRAGAGQPLTMEGFLEPAARRYMKDSGAYAEIFADGELFGGRSGRSLSTLDPWDSRFRFPEVLWGLFVLAGAVSAIDTGNSVELRHGMCSELEVKADLERASQLTDFSLRVPDAQDFNQLRLLPFTVCIDDRHVRRMSWTRDASTKVDVEIWDYGVDTSHLDWSRLPAFSEAT